MSTIDLTSPEIQEAINAAVEDAVKGLQKKNNELLSKLARKGNDANSDSEELERIKNEKDSILDQLKEAQKLSKQITANFEAEKKTREALDNDLSKMIINSALGGELLKAGIKDSDYLDLVMTKFSSQASIKIDGDNRTPMIGDKPLSDFVKEWSETEAAKKFIAAPLNQGGGGNGGGNGGSGQKTISREQFNGKSQAERLEFAKAGGVVAE